jgi:tRNA 5-methylaminomethyl-2-thiouridine biosynthesis bifunctional protein
MAAALRAEGRPVDIIAGKESTAYAASTLPSALIAPKLVRGNQPYARFWRQAFFDSLRVLEDLDLWDGPRGLLIPAQDPLQQQQQEALLSDLAWPEEHLRYVSSRETLQLLGRPSSGGLYLKEAGSIVPDRLRNRLAPEVDFSADVVALEQRGSYWHLKGKGGRLITKAEAVVVAAGPGSSVLLGEAVSLRIAAGRMVQFPSEAASRCSLLSNGYVTSKNPNGLISAGATAEPRASIAPVLEDPEKDAHLFDRIGKNIPDVWKTKGQIWRGLRCDTADHLPLIGPVPDSAAFKRDYDGLIHGKKPSQMAPPVFMPGLYALTGLGARGFQAAFLGADLICAQMHGMPAPLDQRLCAALSVSRSLIKQLKSAGSS